MNLMEIKYNVNYDLKVLTGNSSKKEKKKRKPYRLNTDIILRDDIIIIPAL